MGSDARERERGGRPAAAAAGEARLRSPPPWAQTRIARESKAAWQGLRRLCGVGGAGLCVARGLRAAGSRAALIDRGESGLFSLSLPLSVPFSLNICLSRFLFALSAWLSLSGSLAPFSLRIYEKGVPSLARSLARKPCVRAGSTRGYCAGENASQNAWPHHHRLSLF